MAKWGVLGRATSRVLALIGSFLWMTPVGLSEEVKFQLAWKFGPEFAPYYVALDQGYFAREGLDVQILQGSGSPMAAKLLGARQVTVGLVDAGPMAIALSQDVPLVSFMAVYQKSPMGLASLAETRLERPSDLKGKTIAGYRLSAIDAALKVFLKTHKISTEEVRLVYILEGDPLLLKTADIRTTFVNTDAAVLRSKGHKVNVLLFADWGFQAYGYTLSTHRSVLESRPELIRRFARAAQEGWAFTLADREKAAAIYMKYHPGTERGFALQVLELTKPLVKSEATRIHGFGWQTEERWRKTEDFYYAGGILKKRIDVTKAFTNEMLR